MLHVKPPTYLAHENGSRGYSIKKAMRYATLYRVNLLWLLTGQGDARSSVSEALSGTG
jgi:hypothetical protein